MEQKEIYVNFKLESKEDSRIYLAGSVEFGLDDEDIEWEYEQNDGFHSNRIPTYWKVNGEDLSFEFDQFISTIEFDVVEQELWGCRDENRTFDYGKYILVINEGAKMECIIEPAEERGDFVVEVIPVFNKEKIDLTSYMTDNWEIFDPYDVNLPTSCIEDGHIYFEIDKEYFEADESGREKIMEDINEEAQRIFARHLTHELGIYERYGDMMEQAFDDTWDNEWLFKLSQIEEDEELKEFMDREGFEY